MKTISLINIHIVASLDYSLYEDPAFTDILKEIMEENMFSDIDTFCRVVENAVREYQPLSAIYDDGFIFPAFIKCAPFPGNSSNFSLVIK